ncbi:hypothetical protein ABPG73_003619 [Tetrahymena malaccensis]
MVVGVTACFFQENEDQQASQESKSSPGIHQFEVIETQQQPVQEPPKQQEIQADQAIEVNAAKNKEISFDGSMSSQMVKKDKVNGNRHKIVYKKSRFYIQAAFIGNLDYTKQVHSIFLKKRFEQIRFTFSKEILNKGKNNQPFIVVYKPSGSLKIKYKIFNRNQDDLINK